MERANCLLTAPVNLVFCRRAQFRFRIFVVYLVTVVSDRSPTYKVRNRSRGITNAKCRVLTFCIAGDTEKRHGTETRKDTIRVSLEIAIKS